jgi:F-type H+-transporting ATPase subunit gamma
MPSLLDLRRRIRAVKSTQQITAMKMIAASADAQERGRRAAVRPADGAGAAGLPAASIPHASVVEGACRESGRDDAVDCRHRRQGACGGFNTNIIKPPARSSRLRRW